MGRPSVTYSLLSEVETRLLGVSPGITHARMPWKDPRLGAESGFMRREGTADTKPGKARERSGCNGVRRAAAHGEASRLHTQRLTGWTVSHARGVAKRAREALSRRAEECTRLPQLTEV